MFIVREEPGHGRAVAAPVGDAVVAIQIRDGRGHAAPRQVGGRRAQDQLLVAQVHLPQRGRPVRGRADAHGDIDALLEQVDEAVAEGDRRLQARIFFAQIQQGRHHAQPAIRGGHADAHLARQCRRVFGQHVFRLRQFLQHALAGGVVGAASVAQFQPARAALEQQHAQPFFEARHALADG